MLAVINVANKPGLSVERALRYNGPMSEPARPADAVAPVDDVRARVVAAAAALIAAGGPDAVTTRAVAAAARVQAPTIYRLFGDKRGLLDAVAQAGLAAYVAAKAVREPHPDPVQELREGWDMHVAFGLAHPGLFAIMAGDPGSRSVSPAVAAGLAVLRRRVRNIALAGRLRVGEGRAVALIEAAGQGAVLTLLRQPAGQGDAGLATLAREAVIAAITGETDGADASPAQGAAITLRASLDALLMLSAGEKHLLAELLDRIADAGGSAEAGEGVAA